ncbi:MAG: TPM domain-containing protein [Betaproteobacteria bacterium]|nr:TPM domain-containing protein [Betaproteobacteria bacterium]
MNRALKLLVLLGFCWTGLSAVGDTTIPYLSGRVVDQAEILSAPARERIGNMLRAHERATGNQIAVLTINGIGAESIEDFAVRVFESWKLGDREKNNGVVIVIAPQEHRMRIEVGYGLEGTLTDVVADRIIRNLMTPRFHEENYDVGVEAGATAVIQILENRQPAAADADWAAPAKLASGFHVEPAPMPLAERILISLFVFGIIGLFTFIGIVTPGGMGWFLYVFLIPFWSMFPMAIFGSHAALFIIGTYATLYPIAKILIARMPWYLKAQEDLKTKGVAQIGGMTIRPGGSGGSSGGFSSGGGFSGGGGRSGGGGASGSW